MQHFNIFSKASTLKVGTGELGVIQGVLYCDFFLARLLRIDYLLYKKPENKIWKNHFLEFSAPYFP